MDTISVSLLLTAVSVGVVHTLLGPDHYLPFVVMSRSGGWSFTRTIVVTILCGIAHVLGSVVIGVIGITAGRNLSWINQIETGRGAVAAWLLAGLGLALLVWGLRKALRHRTDGELTQAGAAIQHPAVMPSQQPGLSRQAWVQWTLFLVFVFGPCEPLIPVLMLPASGGSVWSVALVTLTFGIATIATMLTVVLALLYGTSRFRAEFLGRYTHAAAGAVLLSCGLAVMFGL